MKIDESVEILIVDDREDGLLALEALLGDNPQYRLVKAHSGIEAYELLAKHEIALILLDVQMPHMDGFETAELIRTQAAYTGIPILFVTAINKDDRYIYRGYASGAVDYIFKPFDPAILLSKVAVFVDLFLRKREIREQGKLLQRQESLAHQAQMQSIEIENLRRYRNLADAVPLMLWKTSPEGALEYQNLQCELYTGLTLNDAKQMGWQRAMLEKDLKDFLSKWMNSIQARQKFEMEARLRRYDGSYRWHWIQVNPELDSENRILSWLGTCSDIHDRKLDEKKLRQAQKSAEEANAAKTQFLANMSHEIRTPLNAIIGFTDLMLEPTLSDSDRFNSLSIVRRNGQQLLKIIDEMLDISKVEAGGLELEEVETNIGTLLSGLRSLLQVNAAKKKIKLEFRFDGPLPERVMTDATRLRQVLMNLIGNSLKFTHKGSVQVLARCLRKLDQKLYLQFVVTDTGIGIEESLSEKIFMPFLQADSSTTRLYGGTGLGLSLSRKLARALGGEVWLEKSSIGSGSTFMAEVQTEICSGTRWIANFSDFEAEDSGQPLTTSAQSLRGKRVLLAEDAEDNQTLISHFLANLGVHIEIASNGQEAIEKALASDPEVILMDIQMPLLDGYEATSRLRQAGFRHPIIALTAHALPEEREKSFRAGCDAHLTKPLDRQQLVDSLVQHIGTLH